VQTDVLEVGGIEKFKPTPDLQGSPVPNDEVLENIKASAQFNIPVLEKIPPHDGTFIFCAGGPSLRQFVDEIKKRKEAGEVICSSNHTHDFLLKHGIVSDICVIMDPKEIVATYIKNPQKETSYFIGIVCNPKVTQNLLDAGMKVNKLMIAYGMEDERDIQLAQELYPVMPSKSYLVGGTMTGLRAMNFAVILGYPKIEYYGLDSCFASNPTLVSKDDPQFEEVKKRNKGNSYTDADTGEEYTIDEPDDGGFFYAYKKQRSETVQIAKTPDGHIFLTSPVFAHQAKQFIKWADRMDGKIEIVLHGFNLTSQLLKCHKEAIAKATELMGDRRWTTSYAEIQKQMHAEKHYGLWGGHDIDFVGKSIVQIYAKKNIKTVKDLEKIMDTVELQKYMTGDILISNKNVSLLDYGCGSGNLGKSINDVFKCVDVTNYDPFMEQYSQEPEGKFDIVTCFDVMEHIEIQCVLNTIKHIASKAKYMVLFSICCTDALKTLPDGRNAHITQKSPRWWMGQISQYMQVVEAIGIGDFALFACQTFDAQENMENEKNSNG